MTSLLKKLALLCAFLPGLALAQTVTPNIGLQNPAYQSTGWQTAWYYNTAQIDLFLSGNQTLPGLAVAGKFTVPTAAAFSATYPGQIGYDNTANNFHVNDNGLDSLLIVTPAATTIVDGDCPEFNVTLGSVSLADSGYACQQALGYFPLRPSNNLSDVASIPTAMNNLAAQGIEGITVPTASGAATFTQDICSGNIPLTGTVVNNGATVVAGSATCTGGQLGDKLTVMTDREIFNVTGFMNSSGGILGMNAVLASGTITVYLQNNTSTPYTVGTLNLYYGVTR